MTTIRECLIQRAKDGDPSAYVLVLIHERNSKRNQTTRSLERITSALNVVGLTAEEVTKAVETLSNSKSFEETCEEVGGGNVNA